MHPRVRIHIRRTLKHSNAFFIALAAVAILSLSSPETQVERKPPLFRYQPKMAAKSEIIMDDPSKRALALAQSAQSRSIAQLRNLVRIRSLTGEEGPAQVHIEE